MLAKRAHTAAVLIDRVSRGGKHSVRTGSTTTAVRILSVSAVLIVVFYLTKSSAIGKEIRAFEPSYLTGSENPFSFEKAL